MKKALHVIHVNEYKSSSGSMITLKQLLNYIVVIPLYQIVMRLKPSEMERIRMRQNKVNVGRGA